MARICDICDKKPSVANYVSHANNRVKRWVYPNTQKMRYTVAAQPLKKVYRGAVCTKCVKAGKVNKVI